MESSRGMICETWYLDIKDEIEKPQTLNFAIVQFKAKGMITKMPSEYELPIVPDIKSRLTPEAV